MKTKNYILITIILFPLFGLLPAVENKTPEEIKIGYLIVFTHSQTVYDDGIDRVVFSGYNIYDKNHNLILKVGLSYDTPKTVRLNQGEYLIKYYENNSLTTKEVRVEPGITKEI